MLGLSLSGQNYLMDGTAITDCSGFFLDSGGGNGDYGANENFTTTICPDATSGTHVRLTFSAVSIAAGDLLCFFDGTDVTAPSLGCHTAFNPGAAFIIQATAANPTGCLTLTFASDASGQLPGWSADIDCIAACQTIIASLTNTVPAISPPDTGYIDICPGDRVFLDAAGIYPQDGVVYNHSDATSAFFWDFGDGATAVGPSTSHVFNEPGGYIIQLFIEDQFGCGNTNFISQRVRVSTYPDFELAGDIPDEICAGDTISLSANIASIDSTYEVSVTPTEGGFPTGGVRSDSLALPDGNGSSYTTSIAFTNFSPGQVLSDINDLLSICIIAEHSYLRDLEIKLECPDGTEVILHNFAGQMGGGTNLGEPVLLDGTNPIPGTGYEYCWTPNATAGTWIEVANNGSPNTLPAGDYNAFDPLDNLLGCPLNGEWKITVTDLWPQDNGFIFEWSVDFAPELYPLVETFTPEIVDFGWENNSTIIFYSQDSITAVPTNAGNPSYTFSITDNFGCNYDTTVVVDVLPPTHPDCFLCDDIPPVVSLADTSICEGNTVSFDGTPDAPLEDRQITFEAFSNEEFDANVHPPGNPIASSVFISYINPLIMTDPETQIESVCVNIEHSNDSDIEIRLQAPNGVVIELSTDNGGSGNNYTNTCFSPSAVTPIIDGMAPFTGDFQPEGNWGDLTGTNVEGNWVLLVSDDQNGFGGTFIDWSITFNTENEYVYNWTPSATLSCDDCPNPIATPTTDTEYTMTGVDLYGCSVSESVTVFILEEIPGPVLSCGLSDAGNLTVNWMPVAGALAYEVSLDGGATWIPANGALSHTPCLV